VSSEDNGGGNSTVEELLEVWSNAAQQKLVAFGVASLLLPPAPVQTQVRPTTAGMAASAKGKAKGSGKGKQKDPEPNQPQPPPPLLPQKPKRAGRSLKPAKPKLEILDDSPGTLPRDLDVATRIADKQPIPTPLGSKSGDGEESQVGVEAPTSATALSRTRTRTRKGKGKGKASANATHKQQTPHHTKNLPKNQHQLSYNAKLKWVRVSPVANKARKATEQQEFITWQLSLACTRPGYVVIS
jgi:hypothetical protein